MRKLFLGIVLLFPVLAFAEPELKIKEKLDVTMLCYNTDELFTTLKKEFNESPFLAGEADDMATSTMSFWMSKKGDTWTIVASVKEISCIVGTGKNITVIRSGKTI